MTKFALVPIFLLFSLQYILCEREFLVLADIHLDLNYNPNFGPDYFCRDPQFFNADDCQTDDVILARRAFFQNNYGQLGCDLPEVTVASAFDSMKKYIPHPDFVIVLGDSAAHCAQSIEELLQSLEASANYIRTTFPETPIIPVIGNNDLYPHDTLPVGPNQILTHISEIWGEWIPEDEKDTFLKYGYYANREVDGLRVIALNTLFYFKKWCDDNSTVPNCKEGGVDPADQFAWLADQLMSAEFHGESVYLIGHVGPNRARGFGDNWKTSYQRTFFSTISPYSEIIKGILFAHIHRDSFSLVDTSDEIINKIFYFPSFTPRSSSNPAYRKVIYDEISFDLLDMKTYYYDLELYRQYGNLTPYWQLEYVFSEVYDADVTQIFDLCASIVSDPFRFSTFLKFWPSLSQIGFNAAETSHPDFQFFCMITTFFNDDYDDCVNAYQNDDDDGDND